MALALPLELIEIAIDFLHSDPDALAACALVCRTLLPTCRIHFWSKVTVPLLANSKTLQLVKILDIIQTNPDIALYVRSLTIEWAEREGLVPAWNDDTMQLWEKFPNIRVLTFERLSFPAFHPLLHICDSLPYLEELAVIDATALYMRPYPSFRENPIVLKAPPRLKRFRFVGGNIAWTTLIELAQAFIEQGMHTSLEVLDLSWSILLMALWGDTAPPAMAWMPIIASLGSTLQHCTVTLVSPELNARDISNTYDSLAQCPNLRSLGIRCNLRGFVPPGDSAQSPSPFAFLDEFTGRLSRHGAPPFPRLEELTLHWAKRLEALLGCREACENLSRALVTDRERYPSFRRLVVRVDFPWIHRGRDTNLLRTEKEALLENFEMMSTNGVEVKVRVFQ